MPLFISNNFDDQINKKEIFLDNDFLDALYKNESLLKEVLVLFSKSFFLIDSFIGFEFLQTIFISEERETREKFLISEFFYPAVNHPEIVLKMQENGPLLSRMYAHQGGNSKNASITDLMLAGKIMYLKKANPLLISANKKHFSNCIFETMGVITWEKPTTGDSISYFLLKFSDDRFKASYAKLQKI